MHFIFGGRNMGKLAYAKSLVDNPTVCDLSAAEPQTIAAADIVTGVHLFVRKLIRDGISPEEYFREMLPQLQNKTVIGDEIGSGIVPMNKSEREWRDEVGRIYQLLAAGADRVTRVWAGIPEELKRDGQPR